MSLSKTQCPECREIMTSAEGFSPGQTVLCPNCETYFPAEPPAAPTARKKPARAAFDDIEHRTRPRKSFSIVNAIVALFLIALIAGGVYSFVVYRNQEAEKRAKEQAERDANPAKMNGPISDGKTDGKKSPDRKAPPKTTPKGSGPNTAAELGNVITDITGKNPAPSPVDVQRQIALLRPQLIGTWKSKPGDPTDRTIEYRADGTFRDEVTGANGRVLEGKWEATGVIGKKGLKLTRAGSTTVRVIFEGGELIHDADVPGATAVLVKV